MTVVLSAPARQALIGLMLHVTEASNSDLQNLYRITIKKSDRDQLFDAKLITWRKGLRGSIFHELTDKGWARAREELTLAPPKTVPGPASRLLYGTLRHLDALMSKHGYQLSDVFSVEDPGPIVVEDRIRQAYSGLAAEPGDYVSLARLRDELPEIPRERLDEVLLEMDRQRVIQLEPDANRRALSERAKEAAIPLGGEDKHLITIGSS